MRYEEFIVKWSTVAGESIRVDNNHPLDFYLSKDEMDRSKLLFIGGQRSIKVKSSELIKVQVGKRNDGRYAYSFVLKDNNYTEQFYRLCFDIIEMSKGLDNLEESYKKVIRLYEKWQRMMQLTRREVLSDEEIKGLLGELIILYNFLISNENKEEVINSWQGPEEYYQDFVFPSLWYEIKAISKRSEKIIISSLEQLDINSEGRLITVIIDKIETSTTSCTTLNKMVDLIKFELRDDITVLEKFIDKIVKIGYFYCDEYDKSIYQISKINTYRVDDVFPRIRRSDIAIEIGKVKYEILLSCITKWLMGEEVWRYKNLEKNY